MIDFKNNLLLKWQLQNLHYTYLSLCVSNLIDPGIDLIFAQKNITTHINDYLCIYMYSYS